MSFQLTVRCQYCSKHYPACNMVSSAASTRICLNCYEGHTKAVDALAGKREPECQCCQKSLGQLAVEQGVDSVPMTAHWKDGVYQLLCRPCSDRYEQKRRDLYGGTPYAYQKGIGA